MNPYEILGISSESGDDSIRSAYLELVKSYPPERHPEKFRQINTAYNELRDKKSRLKYYLFNEDTWIHSPFEALVSHLSMSTEKKPPKFEKLKEYLRKCSTL